MKRSLCEVYFKEQVRFSTHIQRWKEDQQGLSKKKTSIFPIIQFREKGTLNSILCCLYCSKTTKTLYFFSEMYHWVHSICSELIVNVYLLLGNYTKCVLARILTRMGRKGKFESLEYHFGNPSSSSSFSTSSCFFPNWKFTRICWLW